MKKLLILLSLITASVFSFAGSKTVGKSSKTKEANDFSKSVLYQVFFNDSLVITSYYSNQDFCLTESNKDVLSDGVEIFLEKNYYKLYSPKLKTKFIVRAKRQNLSIGMHLIWLLQIVREHDIEDFNFDNYKTLVQNEKS